MKAAIYARRSRGDKDDPGSVPVQLTACRRRAENEGWEVVEEFEDDRRSAWRRGTKRPGYDALLDAVREGRAQIILVRETERLLRQMSDALAIADLAEEGKLKLLATTMESDTDFRRAREREEFRGRANRAQGYSDFLSEKVSATIDARVENGLWTSSRPYGYQIVPWGGGQGKTLEPDPAEAPIVRLMYEAVLNGRTLTSIARDLNEQRVPTAHGADRWRSTAVRSVLLASRNAGLRVRRGEIVRDKDGKPIKTAWPALVDRRTFDRTAAIITDSERVFRTKSDRYLLTGLAYCDCGRLLIARPLGGKRRYICHDPDRPRGSKTHLGIQASLIESYVIDEALTRPDPGQVTVRNPSAADPALADELAEVEARIAAAQDAYADGVFDRAGYKRIADRLTKRRDRLEEQLAVAATPRKPTFNWLREWLERGAPELRDDEAALTNPKTAEWIRTVVGRVTVKRVGRGTRVPVAKRVKVRFL